MLRNEQGKWCTEANVTRAPGSLRRPMLRSKRARRYCQCALRADLCQISQFFVYTNLRVVLAQFDTAATARHRLTDHSSTDGGRARQRTRHRGVECGRAGVIAV